MSWKTLESTHQLEEIRQVSKSQPVVIFKHSTRCPISTTAWDRMNRSGGRGTEFSAYFLDLIRYRDVSNAIATDFDVPHQSPQVIILWQEKAVYEASHFDIRYQEVVTKAQLLAGTLKN